ncbi:MAG: hypothetical protein V8Q40_00285 [Anaerosacchariphilus sp.]
MEMRFPMIFQEPMTSLNPIIKCGKQIAESLRLHRGMKKKEAMEGAVRMMRAVGIANPEVRARGTSPSDVRRYASA